MGFTPENNGKPASGIWQVVDADALITSTDKGYDDKLQPRNRQRKGSEIQTTEIATNLNPALLGNSAKNNDGAPIIDSRGMVISGNGRTLAIRKAYEVEKPERAQAYKNFVAEQAERLISEGISIAEYNGKVDIAAQKAEIARRQ